VCQRVRHGLHATLALPLDEGRISLQKLCPVGVWHLRLLRANKLAIFILQILALVISRSSQFEIVICDSGVSFSHSLSMFLAQLLQTALRLRLPALHTPLGDFLLVRHR